MRASNEINEISASFVAAQSEFKPPEKNRTVKVKTKTGGDYSFDYATFDELIRCVKEPLGKHGLGFTQFVNKDDIGAVVTTRIVHKSGQWWESDTPIFASGDGAQAFGSGLTYGKRYGLSAMLGLSAEEDDDGNAADGNAAQGQPRQRAQTPTTQQTPAAPPSTNGQRAYTQQFGSFWTAVMAMAKAEPARWKDTAAMGVSIKAAASSCNLNPETLKTDASESDLHRIIDALKQPPAVATPAQSPPSESANAFAGAL